MYSERLDKKITNKLKKDYNIECYSGATSYLFSKSHKLMEKNIPNRKFNEIAFLFSRTNSIQTKKYTPIINKEYGGTSIMGNRIATKAAIKNSLKCISMVLLHAA